MLDESDQRRIAFLDLKEHPLRKDDVSKPSGMGSTNVTVKKFGLATANENAGPGVVISNIYEPEDEYQNLYIGASRDQGLIQPPYFLRTLDRLTQENNALSPAIEAMVTNCDGTGYDFENDDKGEDDADDEEDDANIDSLKDFFREPWPGMSFLTLRKLLRRDLERVGNAYIEVIRNPADEIVFIRHVDAKMMRLVKLDDPVAVPQTVMRMGKPATVKVATRERRYTQDVNGISLVYFKEFGASRDINKNTGLWAPQGGKLAANLRGSEIIHFINVPDAHTPYGVPRWITQLPSILGSRRAEEYNLDFFESGGIPPVLLLLQGGALTKLTKEALQQKTSGGATKLNRVQVVEVEPNSGSFENQAMTRVTVEKFGDTRTTDSMFQKYDDKCEINVRRAFRLPPIFVGAAQDYTFASAFASYTVAEAQVFGPERDEFDEVISMRLIPALGAQFKGYKLRSKPLSISDPTLVLQGLQVAIETNVVNDSDVLKEINIACGTNLKADKELQGIKLNTTKGLNPDGTPIPPPAITGVPASGPTKNPSVSTITNGPKAPASPGGGKVGQSIKPIQGKGPVGPSKGGMTGKGSIKKSAIELTELAVDSVRALIKRDFASLTQYAQELAALDTADQRFVQVASRAYLSKGARDGIDVSGCADTILAAAGRVRAAKAQQLAIAGEVEDKDRLNSDLDGVRGKIQPGDQADRTIKGERFPRTLPAVGVNVAGNISTHDTRPMPLMEDDKPPPKIASRLAKMAAWMSLSA